MPRTDKKLLFRTDANESIGMGHLMRCLSIADAAKDLGAECCFVTADDFGSDLIATRGHRQIVLNTSYREMDQELPAMEHIIERENPTALIVDSYQASNEYLEALSDFATVAYLDDWVNRAIPVDILINYNLFSPIEEYERLYAESGLSLPFTLLGPSFAPLRRAFGKVAPSSFKERAEDVLLLVGGTDPERMAMRMVKHIEADEWLNRGVTFHLMVGASEPDIAELREKDQSEPRFVLHENVDDVAGLMARMDIAVSASGTTLYELCACGIPTVCYTLSDDQEKLSIAFAEKGAMEHGGDYRNARVSLALLFQKLDFLVKHASVREKLGKTAANVVDGRGADRIASNVLSAKAVK